MGLCGVCAGIGKQEAMALIKGSITEHEARGEGVKRWPLQVPKPFLQRAVAWGVYPPLGVALPMCWSHLAALEVRGSGIIPAAPGVPLLGNGGHP